MRVHIVFMDTCSLTSIYEDAAGLMAAGLLLSHDIRRDTSLCIVARCPGMDGGYEWICVYGGRVRNLRPDAESAAGLFKAFLRGRGGDAVRRGRGLPETLGVVVEVRSGNKLETSLAECPDSVTLLYNHAGEYAVDTYLWIPRPERMLPHQVAIANILIDRLCTGGKHGDLDQEARGDRLA